MKELRYKRNDLTKSIFDYAPRSNGAQDFHSLLDEFLKKVKIHRIGKRLWEIIKRKL